MKKTLLTFLIGLFCVFSSFGQTADNDDFQIWQETQITFPILKKKDTAGKTSERLNFFLVGNLRAGRNARDLVDERIGAGFEYRFNRHVSFTPSYLYSASQPSPGRKQFESRLRLALNLEKKWKRFSIRDRNLIEYRFRNNGKNSVRYRNRLTLQYPVLKKGKEIFAPFVFNEIFYDFTEKTVSRNEVSIGVSRKLSANVGADFFYLLRVNRTTTLKYLNVLGFNLKIKVD